jgi:histidinol phosphatase-like PHP family hydrolase
MFDLHGHSLYSDGWSTPGEIVVQAVAGGLSMVGLSDHDTVAGLKDFLNAADRVNLKGKKILPVAGIEISTKQGHLLVAVPKRKMAEKMISEFKKVHHPDAAWVIDHYVSRYDAICVILHPQAKWINGMTIESIKDLLKRIKPNSRAHLGIEIHNWMSQVFFLKRELVETRLQQLNRKWKLAEFSFTDYHFAKHVGRGNTLLTMSNRLSAQNFIQEVKNRNTKPNRKASRSIWELADTVLASVMVEYRSRAVYPAKLW